jgi:acyl-CoA synthetase (NDP forming)
MKITTSASLDDVFSPRNVAVIGSSPSEFYTLSMLLTKMRDHLYLVNPNYKEVHGKKCYPSILDIEGPVDYVIFDIPTRNVPAVARECIQKGVKVIHSFTSGFGETGLAEGKELEKELISIVKGKARLIGPNCMGVYCPKSGLSFHPAATNEEGHIGVIAQSGTFAQFFVYAGRSRNVKISKLVSYGNALDLDCSDFLEYMADDPDTRVIALYIEGVKDGRTLKSALEYASSKKPVIVLKGGVTKQGGRVASSHTGSLAGSGQTWSTVFKQSGVVQVDDFDSLLNTAICLNGSKPPRGKGVSIVTYSGGFGVVQSDMCVKAGLEVPQFSPAVLKELRKIVPTAGTMIGNPLDTWQLFYNYGEGQAGLGEVCKIISGDKNIHSIIVQFDIIRYMLARWGTEYEKRSEIIVSRLLDGLRFARDEAKQLVLITAFLEPYCTNEIERKYTLDFKNRCEAEGFPVYSTLSEAVKVVSDMYKYTEFSLRKSSSKG